MHAHTYIHILYTRTLNREHAEYIEGGHGCWSCVSGLEVVLISSGVNVLFGAEKFNSNSEDQETDNTPITRPLNELLPVHPLTVSPTAPHGLIHTQHKTHVVPPSYTNYTHTHTHAHTHTHSSLLPLHTSTLTCN